MCGIAGFSIPAKHEANHTAQLLQAMGSAIAHRGPDASSTWFDQDFALVHQRLSIIDLSNAGTQPMHSACGRYVIVFNGEIYNYQALKKQLIDLGEQFSTLTDTEVLLKLYQRQGKECLALLNGMFSFVIWDMQLKEVFLARDRLGKKPLYYYQHDQQFAFASEIKALLKLPFVSKKVRQDAVKDFFFYQYIPDPKTIFENVHKLEPGHYAHFSLEGDQKITPIKYWNLRFNATVGRSEKQISDELFSLVNDAVKLRMVSDVPLGAFLSGGIDSSAVVGMMAKHSKTAVTTCAIGFDSEKFDEVTYARKVANLFGTSHHEYTVKETVTANFEQISRYFDEPFADPSFIPTYYVAKLARQQVTVALAGDGGDENFAGYSKYVVDQTEQQLRQRIPAGIRQTLLPPLAKLAGISSATPFRKARSLLTALTASPDEAFFVTNSFFNAELWRYLVTGPFATNTADYRPAELTCAHYQQAEADDHLSRVLYTDIKTYLPGDILVKVDRMTMANSLEARAPLLDYRVVEFAAAIPSMLKLYGKEKKHILKHSLKKLLPEDILYRKKMGFSVPLAHWLSHELRPVAERLFYQANSGLAQCFDLAKVQGLWQRHLAGDHQFTQELWSMLMFEQWWQHYMADAA
ncbi:asparagine synthase (glutamine-hydrolyzing) [Alishewanella sp. HL-SH06]|uniref:asparagine synthase (glutamine-hydrolyzing) n=1 Tax=Alishewanella sp. HL-SH06 TaxID=3461144 RepID=UPI004041B075